MKAIYLLRHAKADSPEYYDADRDRELAREGTRDARRLGQFLAATDQVPDQIVTSSAVRARKTAAALPEGGSWMTNVPLRSTHALYQGQPADVLMEIQRTDDTLDALLLVGHEPAWSTTASQLLGSANVSISAGTCLRIDVETDSWSDVRFGGGILRWMIPPTLLR